jgi:hypothetical protein
VRIIVDLPSFRFNAVHPKYQFRRGHDVFRENGVISGLGRIAGRNDRRSTTVRTPCRRMMQGRPS